MHISREDILIDPQRRFIYYSALKLGIVDRLFRYIDYINSIGNKCPDFSVIGHYTDSVFTKVLDNTNQLALAVENRKVPSYYRRRFTKALSTNDREYLRWFFRNYVEGYSDKDATVSQNYPLTPCIFNFCFNICPVNGGACGSGSTATCFSGQDISKTPICCTSLYLFNPAANFDLVDNPPWITTYSSGLFGVLGQSSTQAGVLTLTGDVIIPSCFPTGGVTLGLDFGVNYTSYGYGTCASSCPSGAPCPSGTAYQCGSSVVYSEAYYPILYYSLNQTFLGNSTYSVWWQATVS
jgi:hypothetical protein